ncbi:MAG: NAD(P)H-hydrate epimerase [Phycisphaerae bacterium]|nr:NAD(P)H-hydrate epimerase [Phycisphaerae bacterium]
MRPMTRDEVREFDRRAIEELGVPGLVLMENAGRQAADAAERMLRAAHGRRALIVAGRGNNGGDGFVIARHLLTRGYEVHVLLAADPAQIVGDAATNLAVLEPLGIDVRRLPEAAATARAAVLLATEDADLVVDALLGTGLRGDVREPHLSAIEAMNASGRLILAVDIPSGLDADTGCPLGAAVMAHTTVTFAAAKTGFSSPEAREFVGELVVADIGVPRMD